MKFLFTILVLILFFAGCNENINEPDSLTPLERWQTYNIHNYSIEQARICFCPDAGEKVKLIIRDDTITSVIRISDSSALQYPFNKYYITIDSLFSIIQNNKTDSLAVNYNGKYGYPENLDINPQQHPIDGGVLYVTSNLQLLR